MKQLFAIGQAVTLKDPKKCWTVATGPDTGVIHNYGPKFGEIVHVLDYDAPPGFMNIVEYSDSGPTNADMSYFQELFVPVISSDELSKALKEIEVLENIS